MHFKQLYKEKRLLQNGGREKLEKNIYHVTINLVTET